jgi:hypothetical protein
VGLCSKAISEMRSSQALARSRIQMATLIKANGKISCRKETAKCSTKTVAYIRALGTKESGTAKER